MARLDSLAASAVYDDIFAGTDPTAFPTTIKLDASEGPLERGTVVVATEAGGNCKPASQALTATDCIYILAEDVEKAEAGDVAEAYQTGYFAVNRLKTDGAYTLVAADKEMLRKSGILVREICEAPDAEGL